jgi:hypothetical protein
MRWLLFQRVDNGEWAPAYGPLSQFADGAVIYAILLGFPGYSVYISLRRIRAGKKEYKGVLWWAILMWPLTLLSGSFHMYVLGSRDFYVAWAAVGVLGIPWLIYGFWRVVPLLFRKS